MFAKTGSGQAQEKLREKMFLQGPEHASSLRARDIAYANIITTVYSRTVTGMVPNYRSGQGGSTCTYDRTEPMVGKNDGVVVDC
jgi:hypothetical protein